MTKIDWAQQWATFAPNFKEGHAFINLGASFPPLKLAPGPGFGDFSHPTTQLTLELMRPRVQNKIIIDIGCGSGILTLAALLMGAHTAQGIDIDDEALLHAVHNRALNPLASEARFARSVALPLKPPVVIAMNMIFCEQKEAWLSQKALHALPATIITSGILISQKESYLEHVSQWGWHLTQEKSEGEWIGFVFEV